MISRPHAIMVLLITLLAAAWFSPCCCQSDWVAEQASRLLRDGGNEDACCCCKPTKEQQRDCCPLGAKGCKQSVGKMLTAKIVVEVAPTPQWIVWVGEPAAAGAMLSWGTPVNRVSHLPPHPDGTLLGLGCALTI
jgi:hypothetical protein